VLPAVSHLYIHGIFKSVFISRVCVFVFTGFLSLYSYPGYLLRRALLPFPLMWQINKTVK